MRPRLDLNALQTFAVTIDNGSIAIESIKAYPLNSAPLNNFFFYDNISILRLDGYYKGLTYEI